MTKQTGLPSSEPISSTLTIRDGDVLSPIQIYGQLATEGSHNHPFDTVTISYYSNNKQVTLWTGITLPESEAGAKCDRKQLLERLITSVSLDTQTEKQEIIKSFAQLSQFEIDELTKALTDEHEKYIALATEQANDIDALQDKAIISWLTWEESQISAASTEESK